MLSLTFKLYTDGGARGNPGDAAYAFILYDDEGGKVDEGASYIGFATNNEAEYFGLLAGLKAARDAGASSVQVIMDSELTVKQMRGEYKVKARNLKPLAENVRELQGDFDRVTFEHVKRDHPEISKADALLNQELDDRELLKKIKKT
ncbi:MAG: ribonuclease HI family protein [Methanomassiliicoccales archaeon]